MATGRDAWGDEVTRAAYDASYEDGVADGYETAAQDLLDELHDAGITNEDLKTGESGGIGTVILWLKENADMSDPTDAAARHDDYTDYHPED